MVNEPINIKTAALLLAANVALQEALEAYAATVEGQRPGALDQLQATIGEAIKNTHTEGLSYGTEAALVEAELALVANAFRLLRQR